MLHRNKVYSKTAAYNLDEEAAARQAEENYWWHVDRFNRQVEIHAEHAKPTQGELFSGETSSD